MQGHRPPSRQKPPPEALHLFGAGLDPGCGAPALRDGPLMRPSTSASVLRNPAHNMPALRQAPAMFMAQSRMTVGDVRNAADEALRQVRGLVHHPCATPDFVCHMSCTVWPACWTMRQSMPCARSAAESFCLSTAWKATFDFSQVSYALRQLCALCMVFGI